MRFRPFRAIRRVVRKVFGGRKRKAVRKRKATVKPFTVKVTVKGTRTAIVPGTDGASGFTCELSDIPNYANFTAVWDQYKILKCRVSYRQLMNNSFVQIGSGFQTLGMIHTTLDNNDAVAPTSIQNMMNDNSYRCTVGNRTHTRTFTPKFLSSAGTSACISKTGWLSVDAPGVSHYGLKSFFEAGAGNTSAPSMYYEPIITYWIAFKDQKSI